MKLSKYIVIELAHTLHHKCKTHTSNKVLLLEDDDVPVHELIQGLVQRDIVVLYPLC